MTITHDDDFLTLAADWLASNRDFAGIVYAHPWSVRIGRSIEDLELIAHAMSPEELRNTIIRLPL